jgi:hypothetical protein
LPFPSTFTITIPPSYTLSPLYSYFPIYYFTNSSSREFRSNKNGFRAASEIRKHFDCGEEEILGGRQEEGRLSKWQ